MNSSISLSNKIGLQAPVASVAALILSWRRTRLEDGGFPTVFTQNTKRNQAFCSLMSSVLLRKVESNKHFRRRSRNSLRQVREPLQAKGLGKEVSASLIWHLSGNIRFSELPGLINVPTVLIVRGGGVPSRQSLTMVDVICDAIAQRGWVAADLDIHGETPSKDTAR